jgi:hypothetical protein
MRRLAKQRLHEIDFSGGWPDRPMREMMHTACTSPADDCKAQNLMVAVAIFDNPNKIARISGNAADTRSAHRSFQSTQKRRPPAQILLRGLVPKGTSDMRQACALPLDAAPADAKSRRISQILSYTYLFDYKRFDATYLAA